MGDPSSKHRSPLSRRAACWSAVAGGRYGRGSDDREKVAAQVPALGAQPQKRCPSPPCAIALQASRLSRWPTECPAVFSCCTRPMRTPRNKEEQWLNGESTSPTLCGTRLGFPPCSGREGQFDPQRRAPPHLRWKGHRTLPKLDN